jgi:putative ABC transport system permease protein
MIKNYLKIAWRNLLRNKAHTFINVTGLSVGMAVAMLIGLWIWDELSYDKYFQNYDRLVRVMQHQTFNGERGTQTSIPLGLGPKLREEYSGLGKDFKYVVMSSWTQGHIIAYNDKKLSQQGNYIQAEAPEMFALKMIKGTRSGLKDPSSILLSAGLAKALFGDADPMNQVIKIDNKYNVKVTGVYEDLPRNTSLNQMAYMLPWDLYISLDPWLKSNLNEWADNSWQMFAQLNPGVHPDVSSVHIKDLKLNALKLANDKLSLSFKPSLFVFPASKWHLYSEFKNGVMTGGKIEFVWLFGIIGVFVLLLACINFMNLSTARSEKRAKEVGIRKTLGSLRQQLISQFFSESLLVATFAFLFAIVLVQLALPWFNQVADKQMAIMWTSPLFWAISLAFSFITGIIAGSYPAFYLSSFQPVKVLKGTFKAGRLASLPRKVLVVLQFTVSVTLIIGTVVVFEQVQFTKNREVGYSRAGMIQVTLRTSDVPNHFTAVQYDLIKSGAITDIAESWSPVTDIQSDDSGFSWEGMAPGLQPDMAVVGINPEFGKTVRWKIKEGRDFSREFLSDSSALIVNETAVKFMSLKDPLGKSIKWYGKNYTIVGVVKDMVMASPYEPVSPTVFRTITSGASLATIRLNPHMNTKEALNKIETMFKQYDPGSPFTYQFTDTEYARKFADEERTGRLAGIFTILAIFISCMGLFGMASFMAAQRVKEIGIRKVLGASIFGLWRLMSKEFVLLVGISLIIATPIAYHYMGNWLANYKYHADLSLWIFGATALGAISITLLTVSYQSIKAAMANPVKSLRSE